MNTQKDFGQYITYLCKPVTLEEAQEYATKGQLFLEKMTNPEKAEELIKSSNEDNNRAADIAYLQWYLVKKSFDDGVGMSAGSVMLHFENEETTKNIFEYLRNGRENIFLESAAKYGPVRNLETSILSYTGIYTSLFNKGMKPLGLNDKNPTYSRVSSHYNDIVCKSGHYGHFGIDAKYSKIPLPRGSGTSAFGLLDENTGDREPRISLYFKLESEGADILRDPMGSLKHFFNLVEYMVNGGATVEGYARKDEKELSKEIVTKAMEIINPNYENLSEKEQKVLHKKVTKAAGSAANKTEGVLKIMDPQQKTEFNRFLENSEDFDPNSYGNEFRVNLDDNLKKIQQTTTPKETYEKRISSILKATGTQEKPYKLKTKNPIKLIKQKSNILNKSKNLKLNTKKDKKPPAPTVDS